MPVCNTLYPVMICDRDTCYSSFSSHSLEMGNVYTQQWVTPVSNTLCHDTIPAWYIIRWWLMVTVDDTYVTLGKSVGRPSYVTANGQKHVLLLLATLMLLLAQHLTTPLMPRRRHLGNFENTIYNYLPSLILIYDLINIIINPGLWCQYYVDVVDSLSLALSRALTTSCFSALWNDLIASLNPQWSSTCSRENRLTNQSLRNKSRFHCPLTLHQPNLVLSITLGLASRCPNFHGVWVMCHIEARHDLEIWFELLFIGRVSWSMILWVISNWSSMCSCEYIRCWNCAARTPHLHFLLS